VFHTAAWARVLIDCYGYEPRYHVIEDESGEIKAGWPALLVSSRLTGRRLVSLPFCDHCAPLIRSSSQAEALLGAIIADRQHLGARLIEVRGWPFAASQLPLPLNPVKYYSLYVAELESDASVPFARMSTTARRYVRQAERKGVTLRLAESRGDLERFYELNLLLRRRHGMLPQPRRFFELIHRYILEPGNGHIFIGEVSGQPIAALMCLTHRDTAMCKFTLSDPDYWEYRPNHLMIAKSVEWACNEGFTRYDFGRCGAQDAGLAQFKEQTGFARSDLVYSYYPAAGGFSVKQPSGVKKLALERFARLAPNPLFRASARLYRHLG
jgi:CelD/BcsL family acetyltransferase involved in cellulose biosynthesis